jgi:hypothetical protein
MNETKYVKIMKVIKSIGYFFMVLYLIIFLKIEPIVGLFNKLPLHSSFEIFITFASLVFIYHAIVDIFQRLKKFIQKF